MFRRGSRAVPAFLWDVDGTIVSSEKFAYDACNEALTQLRKRTFSSQEFRELFQSDYRLHLKHMGIESIQEVEFLDNLWKSKLTTDEQKFKLHDGVLDVLSYLHRRGYKMALVSATSRSQLQRYFRMFEIDKFFSVIIAREDTDELKPSPKPFLKATEQLAVSPKNCIVIDDADDGITAAKKIGAITIGVTWGFSSQRRIYNAKPDFLAENGDELRRIIVERLKF